MSESLPPVPRLARETVSSARQLVLPTLPGLVLFAVAMGAQGWFNRIASGGGAFTLLWLCVSLVTVFVGCFWSADMYRKLMPKDAPQSLFVDAGRLFLANLAVYGLYFILGFLLTLFFSIFAGVLIGTAGYDPSSQASPEQVQQSIEALNSSGGAVLLYILLVVAAAGVIWLGLRLFLFGAATVGEGRLTIFRSWRWTRGHVVRIGLLWALLQFLPWVVLTVLASGLLHLAGVETVFSYATAGQAAGMSGALPDWGQPVLTGLATLILAPFYWLGHGLAVTLYSYLGPQGIDAGDAFE